MKVAVMDLIPGLVGATIGGVVGYFAFDWAFSQQLRAGVIPGAFVGLGGGLLSSNRSVIRGVMCSIGALGVGLFADWKHFPMVADKSFGYLVTHVFEKPPLVLIMLALGTFLGFRWGGDSLKPLPGKPKADATSE